jgi:very-short-patch-repair endonuclease
VIVGELKKGPGERRNPAPIDRARELRRNETDAERQLWQAVRAGQLDGAKFRRQVAIGPYFVDFVCFERRLIVEVDGGHHAEQV